MIARSTTSGSWTASDTRSGRTSKTTRTLSAPAGLNSTGESDLRTYYDGIKQRQESTLRVPVTNIYRAMAASLGIKLPEGFRVDFRSLWQLPEKEKAEIAEITTRTVRDAEEGGLISQAGAMKELQQSSNITGVFTNITDDDIASASEEVLPPAPEGDPNDPPSSSSGAGDDPEGAAGQTKAKKEKPE